MADRHIDPHGSPPGARERVVGSFKLFLKTFTAGRHEACCPKYLARARSDSAESKKIFLSSHQKKGRVHISRSVNPALSRSFGQKPWSVPVSIIPASVRPAEQAAAQPRDQGGAS